MIWKKYLFAMLVLGSLGHMGCDDDDNFEDVDGDETLLTASFGNVELTGQDSEAIVIDVPEGASSLAVILDGLGDVLAQPATITNPDGEVVFEVGVNLTNRSDAFSHTSTTLVPINPDVELIPGEWSFVFFAGAATSADIDALIRVQPPGGTLDMNIYFAGVEGLTAESAGEHAEFQAVLDGVESLYSGSGVTLGERSYYDVTEEKYATLSTTAVGSDELLELLKSKTAARDNRAINLFFVADIENPESSRSLLGVSGGVPGPATMNGTHRSGVAISTANFSAALAGTGDLAAAQEELALVTAHEMGHYVGLFHTTEANGQELPGGLNGQDPVADTPVCPDANDADADGVLSSEECAGEDGNNMMFWSPPNNAKTLSTGQRSILSRNPVVH